MLLNFFKSKSTLKELIPQGFVDIHSHILPGIDDGAKDIQMSLKLISKMNEIGFSKIIATPHTYPGIYENTPESIKKSYEKLKKNLPKNTNIIYASEYMIDDNLSKKIKNKQLLCLKENFVLVEMSYLQAPINLYEIIFELVVNGYKPVLAHPERNFFLHNNFNHYYKLKKVGCYFQANLLSTVDYYGPEVRKILDKLFKNNLIDFVGSDIHNENHISSFDKKIKLKNIKKLKECIFNTIKYFED